MLQIADGFRIVNVVAPIEERRCVNYLRNYFKTSLPAALARLVGRLGNFTIGASGPRTTR